MPKHLTNASHFQSASYDTNQSVWDFFFENRSKNEKNWVEPSFMSCGTDLTRHANFSLWRIYQKLSLKCRIRTFHSLMNAQGLEFNITFWISAVRQKWACSDRISRPSIFSKSLRLSFKSQNFSFLVKKWNFCSFHWKLFKSERRAFDEFIRNRPHLTGFFNISRLEIN